MADSAIQFGAVLRKYRKLRGLTQEKLAEMMGVSERGIMYLENGKYYPEFETLYRLVRMLNIPPESIFNLDGETDETTLESFTSLLRSCKADDQRIVLATAQTLVDQLKQEQNITQSL